MSKKHAIITAVLLCITFLTLLCISAFRDSSDSTKSLSAGEPTPQSFNLDTLTDFFHENLDSFERLRTEVSENDIPFQLTISTWKNEITISSTQRKDIYKNDIVGFDKIISDMKTLSIATVYYFEIDPTKMTFFFASDSDGATLYISYGRSEDEIFGQLFGCVPLYDQWLAYAMVAE